MAQAPRSAGGAGRRGRRRLLVLRSQEPREAAALGGTRRAREKTGVRIDTATGPAPPRAPAARASHDGSSAGRHAAAGSSPGSGPRAGRAARAGAGSVAIRAVRSPERFTRARGAHFPGSRWTVRERAGGLQRPGEQARRRGKHVARLFQRTEGPAGITRSAEGRERSDAVRGGGWCCPAVRELGVSPAVSKLPQAPRNESRHRLALLPAGA